MNNAQTNYSRCADIVADSCASCLADIKTLLDWEESGTDRPHDELGYMNEHGLCFDYVEGGDQEDGYYRYQISYGGPSQEFRFYRPSRFRGSDKVEFWHLDWFDGASVDVTADDTVERLWHWFDLDNLFATRGAA